MASGLPPIEPLRSTTRLIAVPGRNHPRTRSSSASTTPVVRNSFNASKLAKHVVDAEDAVVPPLGPGGHKLHLAVRELLGLHVGRVVGLHEGAVEPLATEDLLAAAGVPPAHHFVVPLRLLGGVVVRHREEPLQAPDDVDVGPVGVADRVVEEVDHCAVPRLPAQLLAGTCALGVHLPAELPAEEAHVLIHRVGQGLLVDEDAFVLEAPHVLLDAEEATVAQEAVVEEAHDQGVLVALGQGDASVQVLALADLAHDAEGSQHGASMAPTLCSDELVGMGPVVLADRLASPP